MAVPKLAVPWITTLPLHTGRAVTITDAGDVVEVRGPTRDVELRVRITPAGPVVEVDATRLELRARDSISLVSRRIAIQASDGLELDGGDGDVLVRGATIYLN